MKQHRYLHITCTNRWLACTTRQARSKKLRHKLGCLFGILLVVDSKGQPFRLVATTDSAGDICSSDRAPSFTNSQRTVQPKKGSVKAIKPDTRTLWTVPVRNAPPDRFLMVFQEELQTGYLTEVTLDQVHGPLRAAFNPAVKPFKATVVPPGTIYRPLDLSSSI